MQKIRTKFDCTGVTKSIHWQRNEDGTNRFHYSASFNVVHQGSEENKKFYAATPTGSINVSTYAEDVFEPGKSYYVEFTPANETGTNTN